MKNPFLRFTGALLVASTLFVALDTAVAGGKSSSKNDRDCRDSRNGRDERDDRDCPKTPTPTPVPVSGSVTLSPTGTIIVTENVVQVSAGYTAPANSGAVLKLLRDNVVIATVSIPASVTSGSSSFTIDVSALPAGLSTTVQAQLSYTTASTSGGGKDDDCDRNKSRSRGGRCDRDDDDDDDRCSGGSSSGSTTTTLLSGTLVIQKGDGGPASG